MYERVSKTQSVSLMNIKVKNRFLFTDAMKGVAVEISTIKLEV